MVTASKKRELNVLVFLHGLQCFHRIVGYGRNVDAHCFDLITDFGQLHELSFTVGSPVERSAHHEEQAFLAFQVVECL